MIKILFVDDEPKVLEGLQRMLRPMRHEWEMSFAGGGREALAAFEQNPFDVIVSDMRMPGMDGAELLSQVRKTYPRSVRIVLSGYCDQEMILRSVGPAHQYLSKPCDAESLKETVMRACALRDLLSNEALQLLASKMQSLPSLPSLYLELVHELESPNASLKKAGQIIARDLGLTAKILQMVNSAFFGLRRSISSPEEAVSLLGLDTVLSLVLTVQTFAKFDQTKVPGLSLDELWSHSMKVATFAKRVAKESGQGTKLADDSFTAGLLHDAGRLVLAANLPDRYGEMMRAAMADQIPLEEAERQAFGAGHPEVGAYLLGLWGLPNEIIEAVAFHDRPRDCLAQSFTPLTAVHVANVLARSGAVAEPPFDGEYLERLNLTGGVAKWRAAYSELYEAQVA